MFYNNRRLGNRGAGLVLALLTLAVLAILAMTVYRMARDLVRESVYQLRQAQAQAIAEAGLEDALRELQQNTSWHAGFKRKPFAGGSYTVSISTDDPPEIASTGYSQPIFILGPAVKTVRAQAKFFWSDNGATLAILANDIVLRGSAHVDSYESTSRVSSPMAGSANLWSNGNLAVEAGAVVLGRAFFHGVSNVSGIVQDGVSQSTFTRALPATPFSSASQVASIVFNGDQGPGCGRYDPRTRDLALYADGCVARLSTGIYFLHDVDVSSGTLLAATEDGPVSIYFDGNLRVGAAGKIQNATAAAEWLGFYGQASSRVDLESSAPLQADWDAPQADIRVGSSQILFGRLIGSHIDLSGTLHFDRALSRGEARHVSWESGSWSESYQRQ